MVRVRAPGFRSRSIFNRMVDLFRACVTMARMDLPVADHLDLIFAALADPTRRSILAMLLEDDMAVTDVAEPFEMSLAAVSKHLALLAEAGLISQEKRGRVKWCKLEPDAMRAASVWMQAFGQFDAVDVDALEALIDARFGDTDDLPAQP